MKKRLGIYRSGTEEIITRFIQSMQEYKTAVRVYNAAAAAEDGYNPSFTAVAVKAAVAREEEEVALPAAMQLSWFVYEYFSFDISQNMTQKGYKQLRFNHSMCMQYVCKHICFAGLNNNKKLLV